jgi:predicted amidohydrolase
MTKKLKIALLQVDLGWEDPEKNRSIFSERIANIKEGVDLIVLPEMFSTGFSMNAEALAEGPEGNSFHWMREIARTGNTAVPGSLIIKDSGNYYNRLFFVFPDGSYKTYDKRHTFTLAKEDQTYTAGTERLIVEYKGWKICPLICYDLRFPVWARNTVDYDLLIYVANWPETRINAWDVLLQARAIENMSYCIGVNRTGEDGNKYRYNGHSAAYDSLGRALFPNERDSEFTEIVTLDREELMQTREKLKFLEDRDSFTIS